MSALGVTVVGAIVLLGLLAQAYQFKKSTSPIPISYTPRYIFNWSPAHAEYRSGVLYLDVEPPSYAYGLTPVLRANAVALHVFHRSFLPLLVGVIIFLGALTYGAFEVASGDLRARAYCMILLKALLFWVVLMIKGYFSGIYAALTLSYGVFHLIEYGVLSILPVVGELLSFALGVQDSMANLVYSVFWICYGVATSLHGVLSVD